MKVALSWWPPTSSPGGRSQAIRGNVLGFLEAGHDVDLYWPDQLDEFRERADGYDVIVAPFYDVYFDDVDTPHLLQMGGWDNPQAEPAYFAEAFERADLLTAIDPGLVRHFAGQTDLDPADVHIIPNAPNRLLFPVQRHGAEEGFVLVPKIGGPYKSADLLNQVAAGSFDTVYEAHVPADPPNLHANVVKRPGMPLASMPRRYAQASIVLNPSLRESGPNVAVEAFLSERPFLSTPNGIGELLTVPTAVIADFTPGVRADECMEQLRGAVGAGDHYRAKPVQELPGLIQDLLHSKERRHGLAERGREWVEAWDYSWEQKAAALVDVVDEA